MTIAHSTLTGTSLHEPKGVAAASDGQYYKADGATSGSWVYPQTGWGQYVDVSSGTQTFTTTAAKIQIDTANIETHLPREIRGISAFWDTTNDKVLPQLAGDALIIRLELPITGKSGSPTLLKFTFDIGGMATITNAINIRDVVVDTPPFDLTFTTSFFVGSTFKTNGLQIFVEVDTGTVDTALPGVFIMKTHSGAI